MFLISDWLVLHKLQALVIRDFFAALYLDELMDRLSEFGEYAAPKNETMCPESQNHYVETYGTLGKVDDLPENSVVERIPQTRKFKSLSIELTHLRKTLDRGSDSTSHRCSSRVLVPENSDGTVRRINPWAGIELGTFGTVKTSSELGWQRSKRIGRELTLVRHLRNRHSSLISKISLEISSLSGRNVQINNNLETAKAELNSSCNGKGGCILTSAPNHGSISNR